MMKSVLLICWMTLLSTGISAQDFASRFLDKREPDTNLKCISISPKMMKEVLKVEVKEEDDDLMEIISNLKSMQMLTADSNGSKYYQEALVILDKNSNRFEPFLSFEDKSENYRIMIRKKKNSIIELVMVVNEDNKFVVINFTGNMNDKFITRLANSMNLKRS